jgi:hypothetical protein
MMTKFKYIILGICVICGSMSCSNMLETESDLVEFEEDNTLNHATDSVYSVMGIINRMQIIADRVVLLGEVRGDLIQPTAAASSDLKKLSAFDFDGENRYNQVSDYYAVINNCNYFLAHIDTAMERRGRNLFMREYAAVKSFRAWTYLQLALNYGEVPLILQPLMTEKDAREAMNQTRVGIQEICETFIADLTPYVGVNLPEWGSVSNSNPKYLFIPMRALLGDLCLWAGRYQEAARWYHDYLTDKYDPKQMNTQSITWANSTQFNSVFDSYGPLNNDNEILSYIPMEPRVFDGTISELVELYNSTTQNNYYYQLTPSANMAKISADQTYCFENDIPGATTKDTLYAPHVGLFRSELVGDLRYYSNYAYSTYGTNNEYSEYNSYQQRIYKASSNVITTYRVTMIYLRYAEALNRAGYPQSAFAILKYGICDEILKNRVDAAELEAAGDLVTFDPELFRFDGKYFGVHSLGSGDSHANQYYTLPQPATELASRQDTIDYQIPLVEDLIITEMALEGSFEGHRFNDLMRVALRRNNPAYLADPISRRNGEADTQLRQKLMNTKNWYLPLQ